MVRAKTILRDGMEKYDEAEDNVSAYEVLADEKSQKYLEGKQVVKVIVVPKKIVNVVIK